MGSRMRLAAVVATTSAVAATLAGELLKRVAVRGGAEAATGHRLGVALCV